MIYKKIPFSSCEVIMQRIELSEQAQKIVDSKAPPNTVIELLNDAQLYIDLCNFIAHALPMREAIWWCALALELRKNEWSELEKDTLKHCKLWVMEPEEAKRRFIEQRQKQHGHDCAIGWLAQAVFWNGSGSIGEPDQAQVMPIAYLYAKAIGGAINTAAIEPQWDNRNKFYQDTFAIAIDIANGGQGKLTNKE